MNRPSNSTLIKDFLNFYIHSQQSIKMRKSSLNFFFSEDYFGYNSHIFDIDTRTLKKYFIFLKNYDEVSIQTRKNKWHILTSFLNFSMEDYEEFNITIPKRSINWNGALPKEKKIISNKDVVASKEEIELILNKLKVNNFKHYLIFRILAETGMRPGELREAKIISFKKEYRHLHIKKGKTGEKIYNISKQLCNELEQYVESRKSENTTEPYMFLTKFLKKYGNRAFNLILKRYLNLLGIKKNITCKTFRITLNTLRKKEMGCDNDTAKELLGHKTNDVNIKHYTKYDYTDLIELYDRYDPYKYLKL